MQTSQSVKHHSIHVPRGWIVAGLALLSWGLVIAAWNAISVSLSILLG